MAQLRRVAHVHLGGFRLLRADGAEILLDGVPVEIGADDAIDLRRTFQILNGGAALDAGADDENRSSRHHTSQCKTPSALRPLMIHACTGTPARIKASPIVDRTGLASQRLIVSAQQPAMNASGTSG